MNNEFLTEKLQDVAQYGPDQVLVNDKGNMTSYRNSVLTHGTKLAVVYIREDSYTLGAPVELENTAYRLYKDRWVGVIRYGINGSSGEMTVLPLIKGRD